MIAILTMKHKDKGQQKNNLVVCLLEFIFTKKIFTFLKPWIKYTDTLKNQLENQLSKTLLELEFNSSHSIISKALKRVVKKLLPSL